MDAAAQSELLNAPTVVAARAAHAAARDVLAQAGLDVPAWDELPDAVRESAVKVTDSLLPLVAKKASE